MGFTIFTAFWLALWGYDSSPMYLLIKKECWGVFSIFFEHSDIKNAKRLNHFESCDMSQFIYSIIFYLISIFVFPSHILPTYSFLTLYVSDIAGGYLCFVVSIFCIGVVTAVIGDIASYFGCTLGIKDAVTAICFVALGTSIPGKWKSQH